MESSKRTWVKSITWRLLGVVVLGAITWYLTKDVQATTGITVIFHSIQLVLFYYHEKMWENVEWGLKKRSDLSEEESKEMEDRLRRLGYLP